MSNMIPWIIAGAALAAAVILFFRMRSADDVASGHRLEAERLDAELQSSRAQLEKASAKSRRASDELVELRKRLDKAKRRAAQSPSQGGAKGASLSRMQEVEAELEATRQARDSAREEAASLGGELSRLRTDMARSAPEKPLLDNTGIAALQKQLEESEARLAPLQAEVDKSRKAVEKSKTKARNQEYLYVSMRGELDVKKDRLRQQQEELERLRAFKVAVVDPLPVVNASEEPPSEPGESEEDEGPRPKLSIGVGGVELVSELAVEAAPVDPPAGGPNEGSEEPPSEPDASDEDEGPRPKLSIGVGGVEVVSEVAVEAAPVDPPAGGPNEGSEEPPSEPDASDQDEGPRPKLSIGVGGVEVVSEVAVEVAAVDPPAGGPNEDSEEPDAKHGPSSVEPG
jgi:hypothetical protein